MIFYSEECEELIGYIFKDKCLLRTAFTHPSYANEHGEESNQRLEFLGDSILNFVIADYFFTLRGGDEGDLTKLRAEFVSTKPIAAAIQKLGLDAFLIRGEGESHCPINEKMRADLFEAIVAAIYKDSSLENAKKFILGNLIGGKRSVKKQEDYKSMLQIYVQKKKLGAIEYRQTGRSGPDHKPLFRCSVAVGDIEASGMGMSKKQAEQSAAKAELEKLKTKRGKQN